MMKSLYQALWLVLLTSFLCACGGGGGESKTPQAQTLSFSQSNVQLEVGQTFSNPAHGQGTGLLTYQSTDSNIVEIDGNGLITAKTAGTTQITAKISADSTFDAAQISATVTVLRAPQTLSFTLQGDQSGFVQSQINNPAITLGTGAIQYVSSAPEIASVDSAGVVSLLRTGTATISANVEQDNRFTAASGNYQITAIALPQQFTFASQGPIALGVGKSLSNTASGQGFGAVSYSSNDEAIATVDSNGIVTAIALGTTGIAATKITDGVYESASANYEIEVIRNPQTLTFSSQGPLNLLVGETKLNPATGLGSGEVSYRSSDENIVTVTAEGEIAVVGYGSATVSAAITLDNRYEAASANYHVNSVARNFDMRAWVGSNKSEVSFSEQVNGIAFYRTSEANCNLAHFSLCDNAALDLLTDTTIVDSAANLWRTAYYTFKFGDHQTTTELSANRFGPLEGFQSVLFKNQIWIVGGKYGSPTKEVWSSTDGKSWHLRTNNAAFSGRYAHKVIVFNNRMWLIGGFDTTGSRNDVWYSEDGITWTQATDNAAFSARAKHEVVVFDNKLWLIAGNALGFKNDIWSSSDGVQWTLENANAAFPARENHQVVLFNNKLWIIGGYDGVYLNDIWSSGNGVLWVQESAGAAFSARAQHQVVPFNNKLWLIGGAGDGPTWLKSDIWSSDDGVTWIQQAESSSFGARYEHQALVFNDQLWIVGSRYADDVWSSSDALSWHQITPFAQFSSRASHSLAIFENKVWLVGGSDGSIRSDVWRSSDLLNWTLTADKVAHLDRFGHQVTAFKDKLWVIGGNSQNDIWSTSNGVNWQQEVNSAPFSARRNHQLTVFNDKLWLIGGVNIQDGQHKNDVWHSDDGVVWNQMTTSALFTGRADHQVIAFNNKLFVIGGFDGNYKNDIWSSSDGANWTQVSAAAAFSARDRHQSVIFDNKLWVIGGTSGPFKNDTWSSEDGETWTLQSNALPFSYVGHKTIVFNNHIIVIGGERVGYSNRVWRSNNGIDWAVGYQDSLSFP